MLNESSRPIRWLAVVSSVIVAVMFSSMIDSFIIQPQLISTFHKNMQVYMNNDLFTDVSVPIRTGGVHASVIPVMKDHRVLDKNGVEFTVDSIVRVSVGGLKAYQVNSKGQGSYNDKKEFVPDASDSKKKCLFLPIGLRGVVRKVYDEDVVSSNLPILVLFTPGENKEEGYDAPTKFLMHFTQSEVEVVVVEV
jgi:hypothetical protein